MKAGESKIDVDAAGQVIAVCSQWGAYHGTFRFAADETDAAMRVLSAEFRENPEAEYLGYLMQDAVAKIEKERELRITTGRKRVELPHAQMLQAASQLRLELDAELAELRKSQQGAMKWLIMKLKFQACATTTQCTRYLYDRSKPRLHTVAGWALRKTPMPRSWKEKIQSSVDPAWRKVLDHGRWTVDHTPFVGQIVRGQLRAVLDSEMVVDLCRPTGEPLARRGPVQSECGTASRWY